VFDPRVHEYFALGLETVARIEVARAELGMQHDVAVAAAPRLIHQGA
jgi:hypothetical protein